jgi:hypothetical protein
VRYRQIQPSSIADATSEEEATRSRRRRWLVTLGFRRGHADLWEEAAPGGRLTAVTAGARSRCSVAGAGAGERRAAAALGGASSREEMRRGREREGRGFFFC